MFDPVFSGLSFVFRPGRYAHHAVRVARRCMDGLSGLWILTWIGSLTGFSELLGPGADVTVTCDTQGKHNPSRVAVRRPRHVRCERCPGTN